MTDRKGRGGGGDKEESERRLALTQDEVVLSQLRVPDLFVQGAAGVQIHVSHEAAAVEVLPDLPQSEGRTRPVTEQQQQPMWAEPLWSLTFCAYSSQVGPTGTTIT